MARRTVLKIRSDATLSGPTPEQIAEGLADFGLVPDQKVRFRLTDGGDWTNGIVKRVEKDGSLQLYAEGRIRSILPERCQVQKIGPRGGKTWEPLT